MKIPISSRGTASFLPPFHRVSGSARFISTTPRWLVSFGFASTKGERPIRPKRTTTENEDPKPRQRQAQPNQDMRRSCDPSALSLRSRRDSTPDPSSSGYGIPRLFERSSRPGDPDGADGRPPRSAPREGSRVSNSPTPLNPIPDFSSLSPIRDRANKVSYPRPTIRSFLLDIGS